MGTVSPFPTRTIGQQSNGQIQSQRAISQQVGFERIELTRILDLYGRMVAAGHWRDYAMDFAADVAMFSAFRRAAERPEFRIEKRPALRLKQGVWALVGEGGATLKRGHDLSGVLAPIERRLLRLIESG